MDFSPRGVGGDALRLYHHAPLPTSTSERTTEAAPQRAKGHKFNAYK